MRAGRPERKKWSFDLMKKITVFIILTAMCLGSLCACSEKKPEGKDAFSSPTVISELLCAYAESVSKNALKPSVSSTAEDDAEYTYMTEDGAQTAHTKLTSSYNAATGAWSVSAKDHTAVFSNGLSVNGQTVRSIADKKALQKAVDVFIKAFAEATDDSDYETAPDSIRAAEDDVETDRVTLKLERDKYLPAFSKALTAVKNDAEAKRYITDVLGFYGLLHDREESADQLFDKVMESLENAVKDSTGQLVWQRYIYNGKAVAARLKFTDNVIRYICAQTESYTELEFSATVGGKEITAAYEARRTGMSDTYNIRISNGDEITYFDGTAESAYKSGNIGFELRATKNAKVVNGCKLDLSFNGEKKLTYKGSGNFTVKGDKKTFSFELVFNDTENVEIPPAQSGETGLYEATERIFK